MFHSVAYEAVSHLEFSHWCKEHCNGEWGTEQAPAHPTGSYVGESEIYFGWLYDDNDAMLFKLSFT